MVGFLDDYIKIAKQRSLGLRSKAKLAGQVARRGDLRRRWRCPSRRPRPDPGVACTSRSSATSSDFTLPAVVVVLLILVMIAGASNAVNLTDGLDGLATGASMMVFGAYTLVNIWQNNQWCALNPGNKCYEVRDPLDLAVGRRRADRRLLRLPVVERLAGQDLHGRHRLAGARRRARRPRDPHPHRVPARASSAACS